MCDRMFALLSPTQGAILDRCGWSSGGASCGFITEPALVPLPFQSGGGRGEEMSACLYRVQPLFLFLSAFSCTRSENRARLLVSSRTSDVGAALTRIRTHRRQHRSTSQDSALPSSCILNNILSFMNLLAHHLLCSDTHDSAPLESSVQAKQ